MSAPALWTVEAMAAAMGAERQGALPQTVSGISIDSRTHRPGRRVLRHSGDRRDGHDFVAAALAAKPALAVVAADAARASCRRTRRCCVVPDVLAALARARRRGAGAHASQGDRRHRLGRQDRNQGGAAAGAVQGRRDPRFGRVLQQSLGRAAVARALSGERALCGPGNGNESRGRDRAAVAAGAPARRDHHHDCAGASRILRLARQDRRRQGGDFSRPRSGRRRGAQSRQFAVRAPEAPRQGGGRRAHRVVRRARKGRRAPDQVRVACRLLDRSGAKFSAPISPTRSARRAAISCTIRWRCWRRPCWSAPISRWRRWRSPNSSPRPDAAR